MFNPYNWFNPFKFFDFKISEKESVEKPEVKSEDYNQGFKDGYLQRNEEMEKLFNFKL
jgi:hypothetical protein